MSPTELVGGADSRGNSSEVSAAQDGSNPRRRGVVRRRGAIAPSKPHGTATTANSKRGRRADAPTAENSRPSEAGSRRTGAWSAAEDELLASAVRSFSGTNWTSISGLVPGRTPKSCRLRWCNQLRPAINKAPFSEWETAVLAVAHGMVGNKWAEIARMLCDGRTDNAVKNLWKCTVCPQGENIWKTNRFLAGNPGITLEELRRLRDDDDDVVGCGSPGEPVGSGTIGGRLSKKCRPPGPLSSQVMPASPEPVVDAENGAPAPLRQPAGDEKVSPLSKSSSFSAPQRTDDPTAAPYCSPKHLGHPHRPLDSTSSRLIPAASKDQLYTFQTGVAEGSSLLNTMQQCLPASDKNSATVFSRRQQLMADHVDSSAFSANSTDFPYACFRTQDVARSTGCSGLDPFGMPSADFSAANQSSDDWFMPQQQAYPQQFHQVHDQQRQNAFQYMENGRMGEMQWPSTQVHRNDTWPTWATGNEEAGSQWPSQFSRVSPFECLQRIGEASHEPRHFLHGGE